MTKVTHSMCFCLHFMATKVTAVTLVVPYQCEWCYSVYWDLCFSHVCMLHVGSNIHLSVFCFFRTGPKMVKDNLLQLAKNHQHTWVPTIYLVRGCDRLDSLQTHVAFFPCEG